jgi:hypothetical protein
MMVTLTTFEVITSFFALCILDLAASVVAATLYSVIPDMMRQALEYRIN